MYTYSVYTKTYLYNKKNQIFHSVIKNTRTYFENSFFHSSSVTTINLKKIDIKVRNKYYNTS